MRIVDKTKRSAPARTRLDAVPVTGIAVVVAAVAASIYGSGVGFVYFLQPAAAALVLGVTLGLILVTTPRANVRHSARRVRELFYRRSTDRAALIEEIVSLARVTRQHGMLEAETRAPESSHPFLRDALLLMLDLTNRAELALALETELSMTERHGETDANTFEVAGGFAPTIGILGTVIGLIQTLRNLAGIEQISAGIGVCFVSTIYGLGLANLVLLPLAHRIRCVVAEECETREMILEGVLCIFDRIHPSIIEARLTSYQRPSEATASEFGMGRLAASTELPEQSSVRP